MFIENIKEEIISTTEAFKRGWADQLGALGRGRLGTESGDEGGRGWSWSPAIHTKGNSKVRMILPVFEDD